MDAQTTGFFGASGVALHGRSAGHSPAAPGEPGALDVFGGVQPIAVKVDNAAGAWPQFGLSSAEVIFEVPVEGGLTRFTALYFNARPTVVGPVRSVRPVDADLLAAFRPVLASTGGQDFVRREIQAAGIEDLVVDRGEFFQILESWREKGELEGLELE